MSVRNYLYRKLLVSAMALALLPGGVWRADQLAAQERDRRERPQNAGSQQQSNSRNNSGRANDRGPRAVAVIEWQADARGRAIPKLVPVVILDGGQLYDAGLYRATPVPMALESGTVYEAQDEGEILGYFTVKGGARANTPHNTSANDGSDSTVDSRPWVGLGDWKTASPRLDLYSNRPQHAEIVRPAMGTINGPIVDENGASADDRTPTKQRTTVYNEEGKEVPSDANDGRPTLKRRGDSEKRGQEGTPRVAPQASTKSTTATPDDDPDRPRLKRQGAEAVGQGQASSSGASGSQSKSDGNANGSSSTSQDSDADPGRPVLRRGTGTEQVNANSGSSRQRTRQSSSPSKNPGSANTSLKGTIPQRVMDRGTREPDESRLGLRTRTYEAVAVSDARSVPDPPLFRHQWAGDEQAQVTQKMTALAEAEISKSLLAGNLGAASAASRATSKTRRPAGGSTRTALAALSGSGADTRPKLEDVRLTALDVSSNNSSEMVFTARQRQPGNRLLYITLVARIDLDGNPRKLFSSVTTSNRLDAVPRLEFIDAVDIDGDGRAELLFRAVRGDYAEFVIYRVGPDKLAEIFHGGEA